MGDHSEAIKLAESIKRAMWASRFKVHPRYAMKDPYGAVNSALVEGNVELLSCYRSSLEAGCGVVGAHYLYPELKARGFKDIERYIEKWRVDLRKELLTTMQNIPGVMGEDGITNDALECIVMAYSSDEEKAHVLASLIKDRQITDPAILDGTYTEYRKHPRSISEGSL